MGGEKIKLKKRGQVIYERGRRDEHNRGAGRDSSWLITMGLPLETVEDVTWRNRGHKGDYNTRKTQNKGEKGACERPVFAEVDRGTCV